MRGRVDNSDWTARPYQRSGSGDRSVLYGYGDGINGRCNGMGWGDGVTGRNGDGWQRGEECKALLWRRR